MSASDVEYYAKLGEVIYLGGRMEMSVVDALRAMAFSDAAHGQIILAGMPMATLLEKMQQIYEVWQDGPERWPAIATFLPAARRAVTLRNQLVHDQFGMFGLAERSVQKKGYRVEPVSPAYLDEALAAMRAASQLTFEVLVDALRDRQARFPSADFQQLLERLRDDPDGGSSVQM